MINQNLSKLKISERHRPVPPVSLLPGKQTQQMIQKNQVSRAGGKMLKNTKKGAASGIKKPGTKKSIQSRESLSETRSNKSMAGKRDDFKVDFDNMGKIEEVLLDYEYELE